MNRPDATPAIANTPPQQDWARQVIHGNYYPHIDGMRCLAVVPVVLYHLLMRICPAGFLGVDIFFVISGYLICGGILRDLQTGVFSLRSFYHRRIRRIFPAYFVVVSCVLAASVYLYHWARIVPLAQTALFSVFFSTNIYFWLDMGYFQPNAHGNPLLNLWSLGVEEQFYILAPIALAILWKIKRSSVIPILLLSCIASLLACVVLGLKGQSTTVFYILPTRAWELLAGALLATLPRSRQSLRSADLLSFLGLVLILLSFWCLTTEKTFLQGGTSVEVLLPFWGSLGIFPFPGLVNIPVILGSLLLLYYGNSGRMAQILCSRSFVGIGKISYSLYLWHWPVIVFSRYITYGHLGTLDIIAALLISLLIAYASWRWVEMPIRVSSRFTPRVAFACVGLGCALLALFCILLISTQGLRDSFRRNVNLYASPPRPFLPNLTKFSSKPPFHPLNTPSVDKNYIHPIGRLDRKPSFCLVGDSHAEALEPGIDAAALTFGRSGIYISQAMHPYVQEESTSTEQNILNWVAENPDIQDIYLVGRWLQEYRIPNGMPELGDKGKIQPVRLDGKTAQLIEANFRHTAQWFSKRGKRVFVFTCVPEYTYFPSDIMARSQIIPLRQPVEITREDYLNRQKPITEILNKLEKEGILTVIPLGSALLSETGTVFMDPTGSPYYKDGDHLTPEGARYVCQKIALLLWPKVP